MRWVSGDVENTCEHSLLLLLFNLPISSWRSIIASKSHWKKNKYKSQHISSLKHPLHVPPDSTVCVLLPRHIPLQEKLCQQKYNSLSPAQDERIAACLLPFRENQNRKVITGCDKGLCFSQGHDRGNVKNFGKNKVTPTVVSRNLHKAVWKVCN